MIRESRRPIVLMNKTWRPLMWIAFGLAGIAVYFAVAVPSRTPPPGEAMIVATASTDGEHSPCG
jgi:hypothetical protein